MKEIARPIRIGFDLSDSRKDNAGELVKCVYTYNSVSKLYPKGWDGWVLSKDAVPVPFDLVSLAMGERVIAGWWTGAVWDGIKLKKDHEVKAWKYRGDR